MKGLDSLNYTNRTLKATYCIFCVLLQWL